MDLILIPRELPSSFGTLRSQVDCFKLHSTSICQVRLDHLSRWRTTGFPLSFRVGGIAKKERDSRTQWTCRNDQFYIGSRSLARARDWKAIGAAVL